MKDVITRKFINKDLIFSDMLLPDPYDYAELARTIDLYKNIFLSQCDNPLGKSVVIGIQPSIDQTACIFACFELGIKICIVDYGRPDNFKQYRYIDPKTELLLPIDFFIVSYKEETDKFDYFNNACNQTIVVEEIEKKDYSKNDKVFATPDTNIMICTSSGTTGTPKVITHSHRFLFNLSKRNTQFYDKSVGITYNLNHGSSFATYFLPALHSRNVTHIYNGGHKFFDEENLTYLKQVDHLMIPYSNQVSEFIETDCAKNKTIYTLSFISEEHMKGYKANKFKDIVSFFGSNETSGPTLINKTSVKNFSSSIYYKVDDFYKTFLKKGELLVKLPFYTNTVIETKDMFSLKHTNRFDFIGRNNLIRINGLEITDKHHVDIIQNEGISEFSIILDTQENKIYLAVFSDCDNLDLKISNIRHSISVKTSNRHTIDKYAVLDMSEFMSGVKVDNELLRTYFRKYIS